MKARLTKRTVIIFNHNQSKLHKNQAEYVKVNQFVVVSLYKLLYGYLISVITIFPKVHYISFLQTQRTFAKLTKQRH